MKLGARGRFHPEDAGLRLPGPDRDGLGYQSSAVSGDPDGDGSMLHEITTRRLRQQ